MRELILLLLFFLFFNKFLVQNKKENTEIDSFLNTAYKNNSDSIKVITRVNNKRIVYQNSYGILVLLLAAGLIFILLRQRIKRKQTRLELKIKEALFQLKERETELKLQLHQIELEIAQERIKSADEAYKHINRILHDELSADIGLLSNKLELIAIEDTELQLSIIHDLQNIRNCIRNIAHEIGYFPDKNLSDYLNEFFEIKKRKYTTINFEFSELPYEKITELIYGQQAKSLFVIIREAVNNATKYAQATKIQTFIALEDDKINIQITDNGKGFDIEKVRKTGLENLKERAFVLKGKLSIQSNKKGTTIRVSVPIDEFNEPIT